MAISPLGLGCWQFSEGRGLGGGYWPALDPEVVREIVRVSLEGGIDWFDTAEAYGYGRSEEVLAGALLACGRTPGDVRIATKWTPVLRFPGSITRTIDTRVARLAPFPIDLHQVHNPWGTFGTVEQVMARMADVVEAGKARAVGVSNFDEGRMRRAHAALAARGLPLASNQVQYSLLDRRIERNGVLAAAKELGITIIAYSPLAQGLLSGKFHEDPSRIGGYRAWRPEFSSRGLARSLPVIEALRDVAAGLGATPSQVALAWLVQAHGDTVVAIPGATRPSHAADNVAAQRLVLDESAIARIDAASQGF
jgi:aryl-alcohol dehydrogenase-like predicted oxidoreductase